MVEKKRIIGIDLGTTNTCVASVRSRIPKVVPTDRGNLILPSVVALSARGEMVVGGVAKDQMVVNPTATVYGAKRLIGRKFSSKVVQELKGYYPYEIVEGQDGEAAVKLGGKTYSLPQISSFVLAHVKKMAEQFLGGAIDQAVISVPAYYNDNQRNAVKEAGKLAGLDVKRIVNEPTAAALAYGFARNLNQKILVYDLGGGTFDVSVVQLHDTVFEVLATGGDTFLGGVDFDNRIIDHVLRFAREEYKVDLAQDAQAMQRIKGAAEAAKIDLTLIPNVTIELPGIAERRGRFIDLRVPFTRDQLNALTGDLVARTFALCERVLEEKGIARGDIAEVILVGGQSRMPLVQQEIQRYFGKPARKGVHPDECVALGAALLADSLGTEDAVTLIDVVSMPIGIALPNGRFRRVVDKNATVPLVKSFRLPPPREAGAATIELDIYQGDSEYLVDNEYLGSLRMPAAFAGRRIDFKLDAECLLTVSVDDPTRGMQPIALATRDTPPQLRAALAKDQAEREEREQSAAVDDAAPEERRGLLSSLRRIWGGGD